jgi:hypothetical protein
MQKAPKMNRSYHKNGLNEPITAAVILLVNVLAAVDWSKVGWDEKAAIERLLNSLKSQNALQLYPSKKFGGPWRDNVGFGTLDSMNADELRYFIEWRLPVWKRNMQGKNWGKTKERVKARYFTVAELILETARKLYSAKFGPYVNSGLYDQIVAKYPLGSNKLADSASWEIKKLGSTSSPITPGNTSGSSVDLDGGAAKNNIPANTIGAVTLSQGSAKDLKNYFQGGGALPSTEPAQGNTKTASMDWLGYTAAASILLGLGWKYLTKKGTKTKAGLNAPVEVSL